VSGGIAPRIELGVVSFTPRPLYPPRKEPLLSIG